jgi:hypothetical protein
MATASLSVSFVCALIASRLRCAEWPCADGTGVIIWLAIFSVGLFVLAAIIAFAAVQAAVEEWNKEKQ